MFIESINLLLEIHLILEHLVVVILQTIELENNGFLILLKLTKGNLQLLATHRAILSRGVFILISLEKLLLGILVLLVGVLEVS